MAGWIKLHRAIQDHWIFEDPEFFKAWMTMLLNANHSDKTKMFNGALITVKRGQFVFGLEAFSATSKISISKLRRLIKLLENNQMIDRQKTNKFSIISITNYDDYQDSDSQTAGKETGKPQANDRQSNKPATTLEECKEVKNDKNVKNNTTAPVRSQVKNPPLDFSSWPQMPSEQTLADWVAMRKRQKANISQTVINRFSKELHVAVGAGMTVDECLAECVTRNWRGFEYSWTTSGKGAGVPRGGAKYPRDSNGLDNWLENENNGDFFEGEVVNG